MDKYPKVFISHAGEDRERFVKPFSTRLREKGVDAWTSFWEILLGDSLVDKIFNEGIAESKIFVVILSKNSINKPWVKKELNIVLVQQISNKSKIIPIILDNCDVPITLQDTAYLRIKDLNNYDDDFNKVINSIFGIYEKPPLGSIPPYNKMELFISNLSKVDNILLKICFEKLLKSKNYNGMLNSFEIVADAKRLQIDEREAHDSLIFLNNKGYMNGDKAFGGSDEYILNIRFSVSGFNECAKKLLPDYDKLILKTAWFIYNKNNEDRYYDFNSHRNKEELNCNLHVLNYIYDLFHLNGFIKVEKLMICRVIKRINPELKRWLETI